MADSIRIGSRITTLTRLGGTLAIAAIAWTSAPVHAQFAKPPITQGQHYYMATHSFNVFIGPNSRTGDPGPLAKLAMEAELPGHSNLGIQMIGSPHTPRVVITSTRSFPASVSW
jgi:hypothetical protein